MMASASVRHLLVDAAIDISSEAELKRDNVAKVPVFSWSRRSRVKRPIKNARPPGAVLSLDSQTHGIGQSARRLRRQNRAGYASHSFGSLIALSGLDATFSRGALLSDFVAEVG
jgi:hypothetical protein